MGYLPHLSPHLEGVSFCTGKLENLEAELLLPSADFFGCTTGCGKGVGAKDLSGCLTVGNMASCGGPFIYHVSIY